MLSSPTSKKIQKMTSWMVSSLLLVLATLFTGCYCACPANCAICLNALYVCNKWVSQYDLSSYNHIGTINANAFIHAGGVIGLDISTNNINTFEDGGFNGLVKLQILNLSHNQINWLPDGIFQPLINLKTLDLSNNYISKLNPNAFTGLTNLTKLYLHNNLITEMTHTEINSLLTKLPSLQNITISTNRWHCDCNITAIQSLLLSSTPDVDDKYTVSCYTPHSLSGSFIFELDFFQEPLCFSAVPSPSPSLFVSPSASSSPLPSLEFFSSLLIMTTPVTPLSSSLMNPVSQLSSSLMLPSHSPPSSLLSVSSSHFLTSPFLAVTSTSIMTFPTVSSLYSSHVIIPTLSSSSVEPQFTLTPTPILQCPENTTITDVGKISWDKTSVNTLTTSNCPYGPPNAVALRYCILSPQNKPVWGTVQGEACFNANNRLQQIYAQGVKADNALILSNELSELPFDFLSDDGLRLFLEITSQLIKFGQSSVAVLVNVLSSIDLLVASSNRLGTVNDETKEKLQSTINTALIEAVNANETQLVFQFSHLLIGAKYSDIDDVLVEINIQQGQLHFVSFFNNLSSGVAVEIHSNKLKGHVVQVTTYNGTDLFNSRCATNSDTCNVQVISPIVVSEISRPTGNENVTVIFNDVMIDSSAGTAYCAIWNNNVGGWDTSNCQMYIQLPNDTVRCECNFLGPVALIQIDDLNSNVTVPTNRTPANPYSQVILITFYVASGLGIFLHIPVIIAAIKVSYKCDYVRNIQALLNHAITQTLVFVVMIVSFQRNEIHELCIALGSFLHYVILVSFIWLVFRPVVLLFSQVRRSIYEKDCFILPFFFMSWTLPIVPVVVNGVVAFADKKIDNLDNCWLETLSFPNYFTYVCLFGASLVTLMVVVSGCVLVCSEYTVTSSSYFQLLNVFIETIVYSAAITFQFVTASFHEEVYLVIMSGLILFSGMYYFTANGLIRTKMRNTMFCQKDGKTSGKPFVGLDTPSVATSLSGTYFDKNEKSAKSQHSAKQHDDISLDYIGFHLGYPIPLYSEVVEGNRIRKKKGFMLNEQMRSSEV